MRQLLRRRLKLMQSLTGELPRPNSRAEPSQSIDLMSDKPNGPAPAAPQGEACHRFHRDPLRRNQLTVHLFLRIKASKQKCRLQMGFHVCRHNAAEAEWMRGFRGLHLTPNTTALTQILCTFP